MSVTVTSQVFVCLFVCLFGSAATIAPWNKSETNGAFIVRPYSRPCDYFTDGKPAFDNARQIKSLIIITISKAMEKK